MSNARHRQADMAREKAREFRRAARCVWLCLRHTHAAVYMCRRLMGCSAGWLCGVCDHRRLLVACGRWGRTKPTCAFSFGTFFKSVVVFWMCAVSLSRPACLRRQEEGGVWGGVGCGALVGLFVGF